MYTRLTYILLIFVLISCGRNSVLQSPETRTNSKKHYDKPYVILISLDGYRHDYVERFAPKNISEKIENGVRAESLIPCFPTKTFPNHYSIATGMYPENHNLVGNVFYDSKLEGTYRVADPTKVQSGEWYGGTPIWNNAELQNMISANFFFVGSEADVKGIRPTFYYNFDWNIPKETRVNQVIDWLKLPKERRPHMISMYFGEVDSKTHKVGASNDEEIKPVIEEIDTVLGDLFNKLDELNLPINVIIVSDHGMKDVSVDNFIPIEKFEEEKNYHIANNGTYFHLYPKKKMNIDSLKTAIESKSEHVTAVKVKGSEYYKENQSNHRLGELIVLADSGYIMMEYKRMTSIRKMGVKTIGQHGYPVDKDMHGIFYAFGPNIKKGKTIPSFRNIHIYPLICEILGLKIPENIDGDKRVLKDIIVK